MSSASFQIVYDGYALEGSTMDVRELAPALLALGNVLDEANNTFNSGHAKISLRVSASFKSGCFGVDLSVVQGILDQALGLLKQTPIESAKELVELLGFIAAPTVGLVKLILWLKNRPIREVIVLADGMVEVVVDGDKIITERKTIELLRNYRLRLALEAAIFEPLDKDGIDTVAFTTGKTNESFIIIEKADKAWFKAPPQDEELLDQSTETVSLQLVSISFKGDNKWRFYDGNSTFYATILDADFLNNVSLSIAQFGAGDILKVSLNKRKWLVGDTLKSEFEVIQVLDHRKGMAQLKIPFSE